MIHTPNQLKAMVRNMSKGNSMQAQIVIRNYMMGRFLERLSLSRHLCERLLRLPVPNGGRPFWLRRVS